MKQRVKDCIKLKKGGRRMIRRKKWISIGVLLSFLLTIVNVPVLAAEMQVGENLSGQKLFGGLFQSNVTTEQAITQIAKSTTKSGRA